MHRFYLAHSLNTFAMRLLSSSRFSLVTCSSNRPKHSMQVLSYALCAFDQFYLPSFSLFPGEQIHSACWTTKEVPAGRQDKPPAASTFFSFYAFYGSSEPLCLFACFLGRFGCEVWPACMADRLERIWRLVIRTWPEQTSSKDAT